MKLDFMQITFNENNSKAYLNISTEKDYEITEEQLLKFLASKEIHYGIVKKTVSEIVNFCMKKRDKIIIAEGLSPTRGENGKVKYLINNKGSVKSDDRGNSDFYDTGIIKTMVENDKIVQIIPPRMGKPGYDVGGKILQGKLGLPFEPKSIMGDGTKLDESGKFILAKINGSYKVKMGKVHVIENIDLAGNLNFSVGNIDTGISIFVKGDIKYGFDCKTKANLSVNGVIEDATIEVGENLICKSGISHGKFPIKVGQIIRTKYIVNRENVSAKEIYVEGSIFSSSVFAEDLIESKKIVGGTTTAKNKIKAYEIGNEKFTQTTLQIGLTIGDIYDMQQYIKKMKELKIEMMQQTNKHDLKKMQIDRGLDQKKDEIVKTGNKQLLEKFNLQKVQKYKLLDEMKEKINSKKNSLLEFRKKYNELKELKNNPKSEVIVTGKIYSNVNIILNTDISYKVSKVMENVNFKVNESGELMPYKNEVQEKKL